MKVEFEIQTKPEKDRLERNANNPEQIVNLSEVQAIKNAIQEHLLFIGMDRGNNIRNIRVLGIGSASGISIDSKEIIRIALLTASEKVILVHNHPSNSLTPSKKDIYITNYTSKILEIFNITMIDHIIVTDKDYYSMGRYNKIKRDFKDEKLNFVESSFLKEENERLRNEITNLTKKENRKRQRDER